MRSIAPKAVIDWCFALVCVAGCLTGCAKYSELKPSGQPAYLRVFNDLNYLLAPANGALPSNEITMLFDPVFDKQGLPNGAAIVGDYIVLRPDFSVSYPANAGNLGVTQQAEWPGSLPVLTAPTINGLDLSSWAQVPSGKHRIMLMGRNTTDTPFVNLPASARTTVIADTTINLTASQVYTMEAVIFDNATNATGAYIRQESFTTAPFTTNNNYLSCYCLTAANLNLNNTGIQGGSHFFPPMNLYYTLYTPVCSNLSATGAISYSCVWPNPTVSHVFFRTITGTFETSAPYDSIPMPPLAGFLNPDGSFVSAGNRPFVSIGVYDQLNGASSINLGVDSAHFSAYGAGPEYAGVRVEFPTFPFDDGLTIATSNSQQISIYPSINIVELINGYPYVIQLHRTFDAPIITN